MSNTATISIKVDPRLKAEVSAFAKQLGVSLTTYISETLESSIKKKIGRNSSEIPRPEVAERWRQQDKDMKEGKNVSQIFTNADDFLKDLME